MNKLEELNETGFKMQTELIREARCIGFPHRFLNLVNNVYFPAK